MKNEMFWIAVSAWLVIATLYCLLLYYSHKIKTLSIDLELSKAECEFYKYRSMLSDKLYQSINKNFKELDKIIRDNERKHCETLHSGSFGILSQSQSHICQD